ncbi:hypothetical protein ACIA8O_16260 [Kitasatospora sp. NPDC051853]|uniref:hypothetical protein n=1 Tax=Kitasatospora sp. NPDC051853 TaxID=3364058 RepID=UPI0037B75309
MEWESAYRAVLAVDIERSAGRGDPALLTIRSALRTMLRESVERSRIDWTACRIDDLGDGLRVTAPPGVRKAALIHPLFDELAARLRAHNQLAGPFTTIRVRMALHAGDVRLGPAGEVAGRPLEVLARLLDAPAVRAELADAPPRTVAVLALSEHFHEETVQAGRPGIVPEDYRRVAVHNKEFTSSAWLRSAGAPATDTTGTTGAPAVTPPAGPTRMNNRATGHGVIYAVQNGVQHITTTRSP